MKGFFLLGVAASMMAVVIRAACMDIKSEKRVFPKAQDFNFQQAYRWNPTADNIEKALRDPSLVFIRNLETISEYNKNIAGVRSLLIRAKDTRFTEYNVLFYTEDRKNEESIESPNRPQSKRKVWTIIIDLTKSPMNNMGWKNFIEREYLQDAEKKSQKTIMYLESFLNIVMYNTFQAESAKISGPPKIESNIFLNLMSTNNVPSIDSLIDSGMRDVVAQLIRRDFKLDSYVLEETIKKEKESIQHIDFSNESMWAEDISYITDRTYMDLNIDYQIAEMLDDFKNTKEDIQNSSTEYNLKLITRIYKLIGALKKIIEDVFRIPAYDEMWASPLVAQYIPETASSNEHILISYRKRWKMTTSEIPATNENISLILAAKSIGDIDALVNNNAKSNILK